MAAATADAAAGGKEMDGEGFGERMFSGEDKIGVERRRSEWKRMKSEEKLGGHGVGIKN